jgi:hypothetical protein
MRQTSRRYCNSPHDLFKKASSSRAVAPQSDYEALEGRLAWVVYTHYITNSQNEKSMGVGSGDMGGHGM